MAESSFRIASPSGVELGTIEPSMVGFVSFRSTRLVNAVGTAVLTLAADMVPWSWWQRDTRLEHWRVAAGIARLEGETLYLLRRRRKLLNEQGQRLIELHFVDVNELLDWRDVAYAAASAEASKTGHADDLIKALVRENLGTLATDTRRALAALTVAPDDGAAPSVTLAFARRRVLSVLQDLADVSYRDGTALFFDLTWDGSGLVFQTYTGARGVDRSSSVLLSPETDSLDDCDLDDDWTEEATAVYAVGRGVQSSRVVKTSIDADRAGSSPFGWRERTISAVELSTDASVQAKADAALAASAPLQRFSGRVVDQGDYGIRWRWGDVVTAEYEGEVRSCRIDGVRLSVAFGGAETLDADLAVVGARREGQRYPSLNFLAGQSVAEESPVLSFTAQPYAVPYGDSAGKIDPSWHYYNYNYIDTWITFGLPGLQLDVSIGGPFIMVLTNQLPRHFLVGNGFDDEFNPNVWRMIEAADLPTHSHDLADLLQGAATSGQYVRWSGTAWVPASIASGDLPSHTHALSNLTQSSATSGQYVRWNGSAWVPASIASGDLPSHTHSLSNLTQSSAATNNYVRWNGSAWVASSLLPASFGSQTANNVLVAPNGFSGNATFRALVAADLPSHTHTLSNLTQSSASSGQFVRWNGSAWVPASIASGDLPYTFSTSPGAGIVPLTGVDSTLAEGFMPETVMLSSAYDTDADGIVDAAESLAGTYTAGALAQVGYVTVLINGVSRRLLVG